MSQPRSFLTASSGKYKHKPVKTRTPHVKQEKNKIKPIAKQRVLRCPQKCTKHLFSIIQTNDARLHSTFKFEKYGINHSFCPTYNKLIGAYEGGIPEFNSDRSIETPTFLSKCQKSETQIESHKFYQQRFRQNLAKATNYTAEDTQHFKLEESSSKRFKKIKDQTLNEALNFYKMILEQKNRRDQQNQKYIKNE